MKLGLPSLLPAVAALVTLLSPLSAHAACKGGAPDGKCEPGPDADDCACDDCIKACSGECTLSSPPVCTLEDSCTCPECWTDEFCTDPTKENCKDDSDCDFFTEGCCCADCASLSQCATFEGDCGQGTGGAGGGAGGAGGAGASGGGGGSVSGERRRGQWRRARASWQRGGGGVGVPEDGGHRGSPWGLSAQACSAGARDEVERRLSLCLAAACEVARLAVRRKRRPAS